VWKGKCQDRPVAVKILRVYSTSDFEKIIRVGSHVLSRSLHRRLMLAVVEVLQGGRDVEDSSSSKRTPAVGSDNG